jgi:hypothetical protein
MPGDQEMNKTVVACVTITAVTFAACFSIYIVSNRYATVNAGSGRVYKVDRRTGESVLIFGSKEIPVKASGKNDEASSYGGSDTPQERELTGLELALLTGRAGLSYGNHYSGSIYNGTRGLTVTEVQITVTTTVAGEEVSRSYRDEVSIPPETTGDFAFDIIVGDKNASYTWSISSATGRPTQ